MIIKKTYFIFFLALLSNFNMMFGQAWEKINTIPTAYSSNYWLDVYFLPSDQNYAWICGYYGMVIRSTDGGNSWNGSTVPVQSNLESVCFTSRQIGYTSGNAGMYKSTDGGATWFSVAPPGITGIWGNYFVNDNYGVCLAEGCSGIQYFCLTTDGGTTWSVFDGNEPNSGLTDAIIYSVGGLGYATSSGKIWKTTDGGATWAIFAISGPNIWQEELCIKNQSFLVPYAGSVCTGGGSGGGMRFSTDDGDNWVPYLTNVPMFGAFLIDEQTGWACGYNQAVYYTSDGGSHWQLRNCGINAGNLDDMWFNDAFNGWVVGEGVYKISIPKVIPSKDSMLFTEVCNPDDKLDSLWLRNISFTSSAASWQIIGDPQGNYSVVYPNQVFNMIPCDSVKIIVRFKPKDTGRKQAKLEINVGGVGIVTIGLDGFGIKQTAAPADTTVIINPAFATLETKKNLKWTASSNAEYIGKITLVDGRGEFSNSSTLPLYLSNAGVMSSFAVTPTDTGWISARFKVSLMPCARDTFITVFAYGVSPILVCADSLKFNLTCINELTDTLLVSNQGNYDLLISKAQLLEKFSSFSIVGWVGNKTYPVTIKPNATEKLLIKFSSNVPVIEEATLRLDNNDYTLVRGRKNPFDIKLVAKFSTTTITTNDSILDFGNVCVGTTQWKKINITNPASSGDTARIFAPAPILNQFNVQASYPIVIQRDSTASITINFTPDRIGSFIDTLEYVEKACEKVLRFVIMGNGVNSLMAVEPGNISGLMQTGLPSSYPVKVINKGSEDINITDVKFNPNYNSISISSIPVLPQLLKSGDTIDFMMEFLSNTDTTIAGKLCFTGESKCPVTACTQINLISSSNWIVLSKDSIGFGFHKCFQNKLLDTLIISNKGGIADTITVLEIRPTGTPYKLLSVPVLPYELGINKSLIIPIEYAPIDEGIHSAQIAVATKNTFNSNFLFVKLLGEYRTVNTTPGDTLIDFGNLEPCDTNYTYKLKYYNTGTLNDTLDISRNQNYLGFAPLPVDVLIVKALDSAEIIIECSPSKFSAINTYQEQFTLTSRICPTAHIIKVNVNIIRPKLIIEPPELAFGVVWAGDTPTKELLLINNSKYDRYVSGLELKPLSQIFRMIETITFPRLIKGGDTLKVHFDCTSQIDGHFTDSVYIYEYSVCKDTTIIPVSADVPKENYKVVVSIGTFEAVPGDSLTIPLVVHNVIPRVKPTSLSYEIQFDKWLFMPHKVYALLNSQSVEVNFQYSNGSIKGTLDSSFASEIFSTGGEIIWVKGEALMSVPESTPLRIIDFTPVSSKALTVQKIDGLLTVSGFCKSLGGFRLQEIPQFVASVLYSNSSDQVELLISSTAPQNAYILITDYIGNAVSKKDINLGIAERHFPINVSEYSSSIYFVSIVSENGQIWREKVIILK